MNKKIIALLLGACLIFALAGCSVSHSSSSSSTVSSTVNGETTTTTTTTENGETHTETTTTTADGTTTTTVDGQVVENTEAAPAAEAADPSDPTGLRADWHKTFTGGAEGTSADNGDKFYFIFDNPDSISVAAMMIASEDGKTLRVFDCGPVQKGDDGVPFIADTVDNTTLPFEIVETNEDGFVFSFQNGVQTQFNFVDLDTIIDDMITIWEGVQNGTVAYDSTKG